MAPSDMEEMWREASKRYTKKSGKRLEDLPKPRSTDELMQQVEQLPWRTCNCMPRRSAATKRPLLTFVGTDKSAATALWWRCEMRPERRKT